MNNLFSILAVASLSAFIGSCVVTTEGIGCDPGSALYCSYGGPPSAAEVGACLLASRVCRDDATWGECEGEVLPVQEDCNTVVDDDCDGLANEGGPDSVNCTCTPSSLVSCYTGPADTEGVGICDTGIQVCNVSGNGFDGCIGEVLPADGEDCTTPDDDNCNGFANESEAGCVCLPNTIQSCYSGPNSSDQIGACKRGERACNNDGKDYGPCYGEVVPAVEGCLTIEDENCDGDPSCHGYHVWSKRFGSAANETVGGITATQNALVIAGRLDGTTAFGGETLSSAGGFDYFVAKFDLDSTHIWSKKFGSDGDQAHVRIAIDKLGNILVAGALLGTIDFGCGPHNNPGEADIVIAKLDPDGACIWSQWYGGPGFQQPEGVAADNDGNVLLSTVFTGGVNFGAGLLQTSVPGARDIAVVKLDPDGKLIWAKQLSGESGGSQGAYGIAVDGNHVVVAGEAAGNLDCPGLVLPGSNDYDAFVLKLDENGDTLWGKRYGSSPDGQLAQSVAVDEQGSVLLIGAFGGTIDFGGGDLVSIGPADAYLAKLDSSGTHLWSRRFGGAGSDIGYQVAPDAAGNIVICGGFTESIDLGAGIFLGNGGPYDGFIAKFTAAGVPVWSQSHGGPGYQYLGVTTSVTGDVLVAGSIQGPSDFGGGILPDLGAFDVVVARLSP